MSRPRVFLMNAKNLEKAKQLLADKNKTVLKATNNLYSQADKALGSEVFSVVDKDLIPPSGNKHDYISMGPYWWPNPETEDGLPYIQKDGQVNPEKYKYDHTKISKMSALVDTLAMAYYFSEEEKYAAHAKKLLYTWFIDDSTKMNPHLEYGQFIPGRCEGRGIGIIETTRLANIVDSIAFLELSKSWTEDDQKGMINWFELYLQWLLESEKGKEEYNKGNNHGTCYDVQASTFALFTNSNHIARNILSKSGEKRIASHIEPDGTQPKEMSRTKGLSYSTMNLRAMFKLAVLADNIGIDLWNYSSGNSGSIKKALDWLIPYYTEKKEWPYQQIISFNDGRVFELLRMASYYYDISYEQYINDLPVSNKNSVRINLKYPKINN